MSVCWGSDATRCVSRLTLVVTLTAFAAGSALAAKAPGSMRTISRVSVGPAGIRVESGDSLDSGESLSVDAHSVRIVDGNRPGTKVEINSPRGTLVIDDDEAGIVRMFADAEVPAGERVEGDVVALVGSVKVHGEVSGNVVAVFGSVHLDTGSQVEGDVVAIGGVLDQADGARVSGESVSLGFLPAWPGVPTLPILLLTVVCGWLLAVFTGWIATLIVPERIVRIGDTVSQRTGLSLLLGLVSLPAVVVACMLLVITVVGIPIAIVLPIVYAVLHGLGQIAACALLGSRLIRRPLGREGLLSSIVVGNLFVAVFFAAGTMLTGPPGILRSFALFFAVLGGLLVLGLSTLGLGAVLVSKLGSAPKEPLASGARDTAGPGSALPAPTATA